MAIAVRGNDGEKYQNYACCEHFIVNECGVGEDEHLGLEMDLWDDDRCRNVFCKENNYPENKFKEKMKK